MDLWATKTRGEDVDEETERLVHRAPKYKPPRHDRRREQVETDRDPDIDGDPDLKSDPDLSLNYKNIGGSLIERVAARYLFAEGAEDSKKVRVRKRETGRVVNISEETLKENAGDYEKVEEGENNAETGKRGEALRALAKDDAHLQEAFGNLVNPKSQLGGIADKNPKLPAASLFKGVKLPEGIETVGDMVEALRAKAPAKAPKSPKTPKPKKGLPKAEAPAEKAPTEEASPETQRSAPETAKPAGEAPKAEAPETKPSGPPEQPKGEVPAKPEGEAPTGKPEGEAPASGKKPKGKGKKKEGEPGQTPEEEQPEPSEAEKAGIQPPKRAEASEAQRMEAASLIVDTFPEDIAAELISKRLHPDDVAQLVSTYHAAKQLPVQDPTAFAERAADFFETDIDRVKPPAKGKNASGDLVPFKSLTPEEQSEAMRQHQVQVTALSLGAKAALTKSLTMPSLMGKPRLPPELASALSAFMLHKGDEKAAGKMSDEMFSNALLSAPGQIDEKVAKQLVSKLSPGAKKLATAYFEASDYHQAKLKFLGSEEDQASEQSSPSSIMKTMRKAKEFFAGQAKQYGDSGTHRAQTVFQVRVLDRLRALEPEKYGEVRTLMAKDQKADYDRQKAKWEKDVWAYEARRHAWEKKQKPYRSAPFEEQPPEEPKKPPLYHLAEDPKQSRKEAEAAFDEVLGRSKTAASVAHRFTYRGHLAMGSGSDKRGVYHGIDPLKNYPQAYPGWQQAHQRDLGEPDYTTILGAAREWLKSSVLSVAVEGITKDQQLRAALDLAIQDSKYQRQIQPLTYNMLLARLAGVPAPGLGQTLLTIREANSSFGPSKKGTTTMKPSSELRKLAAKAAENDPKLAFEMIELAENMEKAPVVSAPVTAATPKTASAPVDDRYGKLRALVIRTAAVDAGAKKVLLPMLQEIKNLG